MENLIESGTVNCILSEREVVVLYKRATTLVFSELAGTTNIPLLERIVLGTPVLCPGFFSVPEQIGDAGFLFDLFNVEDMAEKIYRIWTDENLRQKFIQKSYKIVKDIKLEKYTKQWGQVIKEAINISEV